MLWSACSADRGVPLMFVQRNMIKQVTAYLLDVLKHDKPEEAALQTRLLEINLMYSPPQVAEGIFQNVSSGGRGPAALSLSPGSQLASQDWRIRGLSAVSGLLVRASPPC